MAVPAHRNLGEDAAAVSGSLSASEVIEIHSNLLWKLEDSLSIKIGFIGGLFHTWRCEVVLQRQERGHGVWKDDAAQRAREAEERRRAQAELLIRQWAEGDVKGLLETVVKDWKKYCDHTGAHRKIRQRIQLVTAKWMMGNIKGLVSTVFKTWALEAHRSAEMGAHADKMKQIHDEEIERRDRQIKRAMDELEKRHARAKQDMYVIFAKWEGGQTKGLYIAHLQAWKQYVVNSKAAAKKGLLVKEMMNQWIFGEAEGLKRSVWDAWKGQWCAERTRLQYEDILNGKLGQREEEEAERQRQQEEQAREAVEIMVKKWLLGDIKGLLKEVIAAWHKYTVHAKTVGRSKGSVEMAMARFLAGDRLGLLKEVFAKWKAYYQQVLQENQHADVLDQHKREMEAFLADERHRYERHISELQARLERAHNTVEFSVLAWEGGDNVARKKECFKCWKQFAEDAASQARSRQSVHAAMAKFLLGSKRGLMTEVYKSWKDECAKGRHESLRQEELENLRRQWQSHLDEQQDQWRQSAEDAAREASFRSANEAMRKWLLGETRGLLSSAVKAWRDFTIKNATAEKNSEAAKAAVMRWLEGDRRGRLQMCWSHWVHFLMHSGMHRQLEDANRMVEELKAQVDDHAAKLEMHVNKSKTHLLKYFAALGNANDPVFMVMILSQWRALAQGEKTAENQRQLELALEEQARLAQIAAEQHKEQKLAALEGMGFKSDKAVKMKAFSVWSLQHQKDRQARLHSIAKNTALEKLGRYLEAKDFEHNAKDLLHLCLKEWIRDCHRSHREGVAGELDTLKGLVQQLTQERLALAEQLQVVYQQLDSVTDTLQKELKTKEELANELREANEQMRKSSITTPGSATIDIQEIIDSASRASSPGTSFRDFPKTFRRDASPAGLRRTSSDGNENEEKKPRGLLSAKQNRGTASGTSLTNTPGSATSLSASGKLGRGGLASPRPSLTSKPSSPPGGRPLSPASAVPDWDAAIGRMRDQGIFRKGEAPRL